jgi:hypothetical protein
MTAENTTNVWHSEQPPTADSKELVFVARKIAYD